MLHRKSCHSSGRHLGHIWFNLCGAYRFSVARCKYHHFAHATTRAEMKPTRHPSSQSKCSKSIINMHNYYSLWHLNAIRPELVAMCHANHSPCLCPSDWVFADFYWQPHITVINTCYDSTAIPVQIYITVRLCNFIGFEATRLSQFAFPPLKFTGVGFYSARCFYAVNLCETNWLDSMIYVCWANNSFACSGHRFVLHSVPTCGLFNFRCKCWQIMAKLTHSRV